VTIPTRASGYKITAANWNEVVTAVNANTAASPTPGDSVWTYPSFSMATTAGGKTITIVPDSNQPVRYRKISGGLVVMDGIIAMNITGGSVCNTYDQSDAFAGMSFDVFAFPAGYRADITYAGGNANWPRWNPPAPIPSMGDYQNTVASSNTAYFRVTPAEVAIAYGSSDNWMLKIRNINWSNTNNQLHMNGVSFFAGS